MAGPPRQRGDGPHFRVLGISPSTAAPPARGWTHFPKGIDHDRAGGPASAGILAFAAPRCPMLDDSTQAGFLIATSLDHASTWNDLQGAMLQLSSQSLLSRHFMTRT